MKNSNSKVNGKPTTKLPIILKGTLGADAKLTIDQCSRVAEEGSMTLDQFTRLIIHNGHSEEEFNAWLDARLDATAEDKDAPPTNYVAEEKAGVIAHSSNQTRNGYKGEQVVVSDRYDRKEDDETL